MREQFLSPSSITKHLSLTLEYHSEVLSALLERSSTQARLLALSEFNSYWAETRETLHSWILKVSDSLQFSYKSKELIICIIDAVVSTSGLLLEQQLQQVALCAIFIAVKVEESYSLTFSMLQ